MPTDDTLRARLFALWTSPPDSNADLADELQRLAQVGAVPG